MWSKLRRYMKMYAATIAERTISRVPDTSVCSVLVCISAASPVHIFLKFDPLLDFDWCGACMASPKAWGAHPSGHAFFPIHKTEDFLDFCLVKDQQRVRPQRIHAHITCDGCNAKNIAGVRHKCLQCDGECAH